MTWLDVFVRRKVLEFAEAILHGDEEHRKWLMEAARAFVEGREIPKQR